MELRLRAESSVKIGWFSLSTFAIKMYLYRQIDLPSFLSANACGSDNRL